MEELSELDLLNKNKILSKIGDPNQALENINKKLASDPGNLEVLVEKGNILHITGDPEEALSIIEQVLEENVNHFGAQLTKTKILLDKDQPDEAEELAKQLFQDRAEDSLSILIQADIAYARKDYQKALELYNDYSNKEPDKTYDDLELLNKKIKVQTELGDNAGLLENFNNYLKLDDKDPKLLKLFIDALESQDSAEFDEKRLEAYSALVELEPDNYPIWEKKLDLHLKADQKIESLGCFEVLLNQEPNNFELLTLKLDLLLRIEDNESAEETIEQMLKIQPDNIDLLTKKLDINDSTNANHDVIDTALTIIKLERNNSHAWLKYAQANDALGNLEKAVKGYSKLINLEENNLDYWHKKYEIHKTLNQEDDLLLCYEKLTEADPENVQLIVEYSNFQVNRGDFDKAISILDNFISSHPDIIEVLEVKLDQLNDQEAWEQVIDIAKKIEELDPGNENNIAIRANAYNNLKLHKEALDDYNTLIGLNPDGLEYWSNKLELLKKLSIDQGQLECLNKLIENNQYNLELIFERAQFLIRTRRFSEAVPDMEQLLGEDPNNMDYLKAGTILNFNLGEWNNILDLSNRAMDQDLSEIEILSRRAEAFRSLDKLPEAIEVYDQIIELDFENIDFYLEKSEILKQLNDNQNLLRTSIKAIKLDKTNIAAWNYYTLANINLEKYKAAIKGYRRLVELEPENLTNYEKLLELYKETDDQFGKLFCINNLIERKPENEDYIITKIEVLIDINQNDRAIKELNPLLQASPEDPKLWLLQLKVLRAQQKYQDIIEISNQFFDHVSDDPDMRAVMADAYKNLGQLRESLDCYDSVLNFSPNNLDYLRERMELQLKLNEPALALMTADRLIQADPDNLESFFQKSEILSTIDRPKDALINLEVILKKNPKNLKYLQKKLELLETLERYDAMIDVCDQIIAEEPKNQFAWQKRTMVHERLEQWDEILNDYNTMIELEPEDIKFYERKLMILRNRGDKKGQVQCMSNILKLDPTNYDIRLKRAILYDELGLHKPALDDIKELLKVQPNDIGILAMRMNIYEKLEANKNLIKTADRILQIQPNYKDALVKQAEANYRLGRKSGIIESFKLLTKQYPDELQYWERRFKLLKEIGNKNELLLFIEEFKLANASSPDLQIEIAKFLMEVERFDDAIVWFDLVLKKNPLNEFAQNNKLDALIIMNQPKKALDTLQMLLAIHPDHKNLLLLKCELYDKLQKYDQCISAIDKLLKSSPNDEELLRKKIRYYEILDLEDKALETQQRLWLIGVRQVEDYLREKLLQGTLKKEHVEHLAQLRQKYDINEQVYQEILNQTSGLKTLRPIKNEFSNNNGSKVSEVLEKKEQVRLMREKITDLKTKTDSSEEMYHKMVNRVSRLKTLSTENGVNGNGIGNGNGNGNSNKGRSNGSENGEEFDIEKKLGIKLKSPSKRSNGKLKIKQPPKSDDLVESDNSENSNDDQKNADDTQEPTIAFDGGTEIDNIEKKKNTLDEIKKLLEDI